MIQRLSHVSVYVHDQEAAKKFYVDILGFQVQRDEQSGPFRWLTVTPPGQKDIQFVLLALTPSPMLAAEDVEKLRALQKKGSLGIHLLVTDDCAGTYEELSGKGVEFKQKPTERPYGLEAVFKDDSGNLYCLVQER